jgi:ATP-dependent Lon protease
MGPKDAKKKKEEIEVEVEEHDSDDEDEDDNDEDIYGDENDDTSFNTPQKQNFGIILTSITRSHNRSCSHNSAVNNKQLQDYFNENGNIIYSDNEDTDTDSTKDENDLLNTLKSLPNNKLAEEYMKECEKIVTQKEEKKKEKMEKRKTKHNEIFKAFLKDTSIMNDVDYFSKLDQQTQIKIIQELKQINSKINLEKPYRLSLLESNIPIEIKAIALKKLNSFKNMEPYMGEYSKLKNWVDNFMHIPFNKYQELPINFSDGVEKCHEFMDNAKRILDQTTYGLNDAKMQIMQLLGQFLVNPGSIGTAIAIHGPPGTGKTSLIKDGISRILNRPFELIALGGATDSSLLEGHSYTYEGSNWGKIVQILINSKCMNPIIYFDELDKISETTKGDEIVGILTHLTDITQNTQFHDKYFRDVNFDLSKCLFIFSYNDESKINPILRDRMYRIQTKGYNTKEKTVIANDYLLPKIREQFKFEEEDILITKESIEYIVENFCEKEEGVRNLKRCLEIIYSKLNLFRLMKPETNLFNAELNLKVQFPITVTKDIVDKLIKTYQKDKSYMNSLYI